MDVLLRLPKEMVADLEAIRLRLGARSRNALIRKTLEEFVANYDGRTLLDELAEDAHRAEVQAAVVTLAALDELPTPPEPAAASVAEAPAPLPPLETVFAATVRWWAVSPIAAHLGLETGEITDEVDPEDLNTVWDRAWTNAYGVQTAVAIAKRKGIDTEAFEKLVDSMG